MTKTKQIWYRYTNDKKQLTLDCYELLSRLYIQIGQNPEPEIIVALNKIFVEDLASFYGSMEMEEVSYALNKGIRETEPPVFINVPTWSKFLRDHKNKEIKRRANNQIEEYTIYRKRIKSMNQLIEGREVKKIGNAINNK